ncbi:MAG: aminoacyl-tRNA hydrolase [Alphaproteobacteria bacterium]|nr:aminoacyl-tRNA hydrolase [Alphaproteobacteria bacterium]
MILITPMIALDEEELQFRFIRASGPGGQNVNKVATAVELRFDFRHSPSLPDHVREQMEEIAGNRATAEGVIIIKAQAHRTQERNKAEAVERLVDMLKKAAIILPARKKTKPTKASKTRRLESKAKRAEVKARRARPGTDLN